MNYSTEVTSRLLECGIVPVEVTIEHRPRTTGVSSMKLVRGARDRLLFVLYIILRQLLLGLGIISRGPAMSTPHPPVLFCGGRGSATIIRALLRRTDVELTLIVNAYDDGLSTGALRDFIPGMLGPSDFRKNLSYLFGNYSQAQYALKSLMEYRLPGGGGNRKAGAISPPRRPTACWMNLWRAGSHSCQPATLAPAARASGTFLRPCGGGSFDYRDCSLGNLVFAGGYLAHDKISTRPPPSR